jgi:hypothetical protein
MAFETGTASDHSDLFQKLRTFLKAGANAAQTLTLTANAGNTETVTIGAKTYTFQTVLTNTDGNVFIGATMSATLDNLRAAINLDPAGAGTLYAAATTAHPTARAVRGAGNTLVARALTPGTGGNALTTTEALANGSWGAATMAGGGALAWTELGYNAGAPTAIYQAPGLSGVEEIHIGFGTEASVGTDSYALTGWMFRSYNSGLGHQSQPGHSGLGYHPIWNQPMKYWFMGNGQRVVIITKVSTVYTASYLGKFLMYGTPGEYPQPYARLMPQSANTRWSSTDERFRNFFDPGQHTGSHFLHTSGVWYQVANYTQSSGESGTDGTNYIWPFKAQFGGTPSAATTRYRELRDNVDDSSYTMWPLVLCGENPATDIYGELDGCFACPGFDAGSEDFITQNNEDHVLVQNTFRTTRYYYAAVEFK